MVRPTPFAPLMMKFRNFGKTLFGPVRKYAVNYCSHLKAFTHIRMCARVCGQAFALVCVLWVGHAFPVLMIITQSSAYCLISDPQQQAPSRPHKVHKIFPALAAGASSACAYACVSVRSRALVCVSARIFYVAYWTAIHNKLCIYSMYVHVYASSS